MGRVLNYNIKKDGAFTKKEKVIMHTHTLFYNSGEYENVWTCENLWLSPYNYYPNWKGRSKTGKVDSWDEVNARFEELEKLPRYASLEEGVRQAEIIEQLYKEKFILYHGNNKSEVSGFTKVQGNEFNAALVYMALVELSQKLPQCIINLSDEGEYLLCAIRIKNGQVQPNLSRSRDDIDGWITRTALAKDSRFNILSELQAPEGMEKGIINDLGIANSYDESMLKYINLELQKIHEIVQKVKPFMKSDYVCLHNIQNSWYKPALFARPVDPEDFKEYKISAATMMAGFSGEYWKLDPSKDDEKESYEAIARMTGLFGGGDLGISVLGINH